MSKGMDQQEANQERTGPDHEGKTCREEGQEGSQGRNALIPQPSASDG